MASKYVLVRTMSGAMFVIKREDFELHVRNLGDPYDKHIIVAESDGMDELYRFKHLSEEDDEGGNV